MFVEEVQSKLEIYVAPNDTFDIIRILLGYTLYVCGGSTEQAGNIAPNDTCDIFDASSR